MPKDKIIPEDKQIKIPDKLPVLPLRDLVVFPHMVLPLVIGRESTLSAIDEGTFKGQMILLIAQKDPGEEEPKSKDMYRVGVLGRIIQMLKLPNGLAKVLVEGLTRVQVVRYAKQDDYLQARYRLLNDNEEHTTHIEAAHRHLSALFKEFISANRQIPDEITMTIDQISNSRHLPRDIKQARMQLKQLKKFFSFITHFGSFGHCLAAF